MAAPGLARYAWGMESWQPCPRAFANLLAAVFALLQRTQPDPAQYDVVWYGPHWLRPGRRERWCPTRFMLYGGQLFGSVRVGSDWQEIVWRIGHDEVRFEGRFGWSSVRSDEPLWTEVLRQVRDRLRRALRDPERYHRFVDRVLPPDCRDGKIQRHWTWPRGVRTAMPERTIARAAAALAAGRARRPWPTFTLRRLRACETIAYGAAFPELRKLSPQRQRERRADTRHGGLLDLPPDDAAAFTRWYHGGARSGAHPFEIVFANPHGILLQPVEPFDEGPDRPPPGKRGWRLLLSVHALGYYTHALRMLIALDRARAPVDLVHDEAVFAAVRGDDEVDVGPDLYSVRYADLAERRPAALRHVRWQPVPRIEPIDAGQTARVEQVLRTGRPVPPAEPSAG